METSSFLDLGLSAATLQGARDAGYETPTPVQAEAIPLLLAGHDVVAQAQTGTGKTAAFALPLLEMLDPRKPAVQALVVCPTRELAVQVAEAIFVLGRSLGFRVTPIYGGQPINRQIHALQSGAQIVAGTPGRLLDHLRRGTLVVENVRCVVLDEADEILAMGFIEDIELLLSQLPAERQTALFSATMPAPIVRLAAKHLRDPQRITTSTAGQAVPQIRHWFYEVPGARKAEALVRILDMEKPGPTILFCRTRREAHELSEYLGGLGHSAESLHGDMAQAERDRVMLRFRQGHAGVLVATDLAARGLDIESVTHVINFDLPWDVESYTHRVGRTGRAGREGEAITLVTARERQRIRSLERALGVRVLSARVPSLDEIAARRRERFKNALLETVDQGGLSAYLRTVDELEADCDLRELAAAAMKLLWEDRTEAPQEAGDGRREAGPRSSTAARIEVARNGAAPQNGAVPQNGAALQRGAAPQSAVLLRDSVPQNGVAPQNGVVLQPVAVRKNDVVPPPVAVAENGGVSPPVAVAENGVVSPPVAVAESSVVLQPDAVLQNGVALPPDAVPESGVVQQPDAVPENGVVQQNGAVPYAEAEARTGAVSQNGATPEIGAAPQPPASEGMNAPISVCRETSAQQDSAPLPEPAGDDRVLLLPTPDPEVLPVRSDECNAGEETDLVAGSRGANESAWDPAWDENGSGRALGAGTTRVRVSLGNLHSLKRKDLTGVLVERAGLMREDITGIRIEDDCTFLNVPTTAVRQVVEVLVSARLRGRSARVETMGPGPDRDPAGGERSGGRGESSRAPRRSRERVAL